MFLFKVLVFCQISRVYVACANLCYIIVELAHEVLLFAEPREILFYHKSQNSIHLFETQNQQICPYKMTTLG